MSAMREKDQADFDLERFVEMFDEALTSQDERVVTALRNLLMIVTLTRPETATAMGRQNGPLRRLFEDMHHLNRRLSTLEDQVHSVRYAKEESAKMYPEEKYSYAQAAQVAQQMDQDIINQLKTAARAKGLLHK